MRFIFWIACWTCYYIGDLVSKILYLNTESEFWCNFWYPIYNSLMSSSSNTQDKVNPIDLKYWVWNPVEHKETNDSQA
jgi:hypothetical protein